MAAFVGFVIGVVAAIIGVIFFVVSEASNDGD